MRTTMAVAPLWASTIETTLFAFIVSIGAFACGGGTSVPQDSTVVVEDGLETASFGKNMAGIDVEKIRFGTTGQNLEMTITLARSLKNYMEGGRAGAAIVRLGIDIDNDVSTGGNMWSELGKEGYEHWIMVLIFQNRGNASASHYLASYILATYDADGSERERGRGTDEERIARNRLDGNKVTISIPYSELGLASGQTIRLTAMEAEASGTADEIFLPDAVVPVR